MSANCFSFWFLGDLVCQTVYRGFALGPSNESRWCRHWLPLSRKEKRKKCVAFWDTQGWCVPLWTTNLRTKRKFLDMCLADPDVAWGYVYRMWIDSGSKCIDLNTAGK